MQDRACGLRFALAGDHRGCESPEVRCDCDGVPRPAGCFRAAARQRDSESADAQHDSGARVALATVRSGNCRRSANPHSERPRSAFVTRSDWYGMKSRRKRLAWIAAGRRALEIAILSNERPRCSPTRQLLDSAALLPATPTAHGMLDYDTPCTPLKST